MPVALVVSPHALDAACLPQQKGERRATITAAPQ
jgi:hypothetical protein